MEILGIDVGGSGIKGAPVDLRTGRLTATRKRVSTPPGAKSRPVAGCVADIVRFFEWNGPVGCCFPARIKNGVATTAANIDDGWIGTRVTSLFTEATGCPFVVLNDADAAGIAEMEFGVGKSLSGLVLFLTFGTGIGSALFSGHTLIPNTEFGHFYLHGHVAERYASDRARKDEDLTWGEWAARAQDYLDHIERLLDIDAIVLGGGISKIKKRTKYLHLLDTRARLLTAELKNDAGIVGAAFAAQSLVGNAVDRT